MRHTSLDASLRRLHTSGMKQLLPKSLILLFVITALAGCETPVNEAIFPEQTFQHLPRIFLNIAEIQITPLYKLSGKPPNIEHEMPVPPHKAILRWVNDRLVATGTSGKAVITIQEASVIETHLKSIGGVKSAFTNEQSERYNATIKVQIKIISNNPLRVAEASATSRRSQTVAENSTLLERRTLWYELTEKLMHSFDKVFEIQIRKHLSEFIK